VCLISCPGGILVSLDAQHKHICVVHNSSSKWSNSDEAELTGKFLILYVSFTTLKVFIGCYRFIPNLGCLLPFATGSASHSVDETTHGAYQTKNKPPPFLSRSTNTTILSQMITQIPFPTYCVHGVCNSFGA